MISIDVAVLRSLPRNAGAGRWPTACNVGARLAISPDVARSVIGRLRTRGLVEDDGERPRGFARTHRGEVVLEEIV